MKIDGISDIRFPHRQLVIMHCCRNNGCMIVWCRGKKLCPCVRKAWWSPLIYFRRYSYSVLRSFIQIQFIKPDSWNLTLKFILDCKKVYILPTIFMHKQRRTNCFVWKCARMINHYLQHLYITPRFRYTIYTYVDLLIVEMKWIVSTVFSQICNWEQIRIDSYKHSCRSHCVLSPIYVS